MSIVDDLPALTTPPAGVSSSRGDERLAILHEAMRDLSSTLPTDEIVARLLGRALQHLQSGIASILLIDSEGGLRMAHALGLSGSVMESTRVELGEGVSGHVVLTGEGLLVEDVEGDHWARRLGHEGHFEGAVLSAPLVHDGHAIGVLNVSKPAAGRDYDFADLQLVETLAGQAALALGNARRYADAPREAQHDPLTGLANHAQLRRQLEIELARARRHGRELGLVLLDADRFAKINDRHGHAAGDLALMGLARVLRSRTRAHDLPARQGGEQFAVLLPETGPQGTAGFAEKIRKAVVEARLGPGGGRLSVSLGTAVFPRDGADPDELFEAAERRLGVAKSTGRDRVCTED